MAASSFWWFALLFFFGAAFDHRAIIVSGFFCSLILLFAAGQLFWVLFYSRFVSLDQSIMLDGNSIVLLLLAAKRALKGVFVQSGCLCL
jgi:hypothetical protein